MATQQFVLGTLPPAPRGRCPEIRRARRYLEATHASVSGLLDSFNVVHEKKTTSRENAQGRLGRDEVDLLRAALVFTSSGLDASCHTLVRECIPVLVDRPGSTAATKFELFLDEQGRNPSSDFLAALKEPNPRTRFVDLYAEAKTKASYQGTSDLKDRIRDLLGIPNKRRCPRTGSTNSTASPRETTSCTVWTTSTHAASHKSATLGRRATWFRSVTLSSCWSQTWSTLLPRSSAASRPPAVLGCAELPPATATSTPRHRARPLTASQGADDEALPLGRVWGEVARAHRQDRLGV